jgi:glycosyltransferase involved in cell wall biosynthesis
VSTLKVTDIFVNPSYNEGLPTSILEAGVCRRAIIATSVGGTLEIITPEQSGIIINPYSTKELKNALKKLLDNSELRKRLGENARIEIEQKFNWGDTVSSYLKEIELIRRKI